MISLKARLRRGSAPALQPLCLDLLYLGGLLAGLPYLFLAGKGGRVVEHVLRRFRETPSRRGDRPCLLLHGLSVGEILSARTFLQKFTDEFPGWDVVLSTTTRAGREAGQHHYPDRLLVPYPFDLSGLVKRTFDRIRPDLVLIVEHELWPNFLREAGARGIPVAIVNGRLSRRSLRGYYWISRILPWPPASIVKFCVEDHESAAGFARLGVPRERIHVTGNFKFDNVPEEVPPSPGSGRREMLGLNGSHWVLAASSTHRGEEDALLEAFAAMAHRDPRARLIIAPRRVERSGELDSLIRRRGFQPLRWSRRAGWGGDGLGNGNGCISEQNGVVELESARSKNVLVVDTVGELPGFLAAADVVFVGGSLVPFGGHNVVEPAGLARPVIVGPHYGNFRSVVTTFLERDALLVARDRRHLRQQLQDLRSDPDRARDLGRRARQTALEHCGASERTLDVLRPLIGQAAPVTR